MTRPHTPNVRYGIIGCGMMGQEHLRNIALLPGASVSCIFEPDDAMAASSLALAPGARRASSLAEVVTAADVDCLLIASPNFRHAEQLRQIAALRPLPVLLEKPACTSLTDVHELAELDDEQRVRRAGAGALAPLLESVTPSLVRRGQARSLVLTGQRLQVGWLTVQIGRAHV